MNGILALWKPKGFTSHDCVMKIRKLFKTRKVGHTGTLDPDVEGVLPICLGEATKIIPFLGEKKVYLAQVYLGKATDTEDSSGTVVASKSFTEKLTNEQIDDIFKQFLGDIVQIPPMYSAVKVKGKRLYEYARENIEVERPKRNVTIYELTRLESQADNESFDEFKFKVVCSKGTYIRTLCVDIGKKLGYPAHMSFLQRIESDSFKQNESLTFAEIEHALSESRQEELLHPIVRGLQHLDVIQVNDSLKRKILNGQKLEKSKFNIKSDPFIMMHNDELLAIYETHNNECEIKPVRVFNVTKNEGEQK